MSYGIEVESGPSNSTKVQIGGSMKARIADKDIYFLRVGDKIVIDREHGILPESERKAALEVVKQ